MFSKRKVFCFFSRTCICIILILIVLIVIKINPSFKTHFYTYVYENNISFAQINKFYEKYAGSSFPFKDYFKDSTKPVFNEKLTYEEVEKYLDGVKLIVDTNYLIPALEDGLVIFLGEKEGYGNTLIISQSNGIDVWYSNIENVAVSLYDYVEKGGLIGNSKDNSFYLVFKKDGQILDYEEYI